MRNLDSRKTRWQSLRVKFLLPIALFSFLALPVSAVAAGNEPFGWTDIAPPVSHIGQERPFISRPGSPAPVVRLSSPRSSTVRVRLYCLPDDNQGSNRDCEGSLRLWGYIPGYTKSKATWTSCGCKADSIRVGEFFGKRSYFIRAGRSAVINVPMPAWRDDHRYLKVSGQRDAVYRANCGKPQRQQALQLLAQATATGGYASHRRLSLHLPPEHLIRRRRSSCS